MKISKEFKFEAAHKLPWHKGKCFNVHGHSYKLIVSIEGQLNENGIIMDFGDLKEIVNREIIDKLDHSYLNDIFKSPTAENMVLWMLEVLKDKIVFRPITVRLYETATSYAEETLNYDFALPIINKYEYAAN